MSKVGRNDACPCGSGKKFKRCCIERVEAEARIAQLESQRQQLTVKHDRLTVALKEARSGAAEPSRFDEFDQLSERVLGLIEDGQLDEAEAMARQLEGGFTDHTIGIERLGEVYEARGMAPEAAQHYRRAVAMMDDWGEGH